MKDAWYLDKTMRWVPALQGEILSELRGLSSNNQLSDRICIVKEAKIRHDVEPRADLCRGPNIPVSEKKV